MNKTTQLGRLGEIFVMRTLLDNGWKFPKSYKKSMYGIDWVFEKDGRVIKVQVKASIRRKKFKCNSRTFDYLIFTNLKDLWIIPVEMINESKNRLTKTFNKLKNKVGLLDLEGEELLKKVIDCRIKPSDIDSISNFFKKPLIIG